MCAHCPPLREAGTQRTVPGCSGHPAHSAACSDHPRAAPCSHAPSARRCAPAAHLPGEAGTGRTVPTCTAAGQPMPRATVLAGLARRPRPSAGPQIAQHSRGAAVRAAREDGRTDSASLGQRDPPGSTTRQAARPSGSTTRQAARPSGSASVRQRVRQAARPSGSASVRQRVRQAARPSGSASVRRGRRPPGRATARQRVRQAGRPPGRATVGQGDRQTRTSATRAIDSSVM